MTNFRLKKAVSAISTAALLCTATAVPLMLGNSQAIANTSTAAKSGRLGKFKHILLLSVDGLHAADLTDAATNQYLPSILGLGKTGVFYTDAFSSKPSDSFPGTLAVLTGASPRTTGVYYDDSYDYTLTAPGGSVTTAKGTEVQLAENIDIDSDLLSGGGVPGFNASSIDPAKLPLRCNQQQCTPVYPHRYVKVNTIFNVAKAAGLLTAFSDKHPAYDIANGHPGNGVDELFTPEINALVAIQNNVLVDKSTCTPQPDCVKSLAVVTSSVPLTEKYDDLKVAAVLNEIKGLDPSGTAKRGVPAIFGMNFQAVSVAEKALKNGNGQPDGGIPTVGNPSPLLTDALAHTDFMIGQIITALKHTADGDGQSLFDTTLVIVYGKHGQAPRLGAATIVPESVVPDALTQAGFPVAQATQDDVGLIWLEDPSQAQAAAAFLNQFKVSHPGAGIQSVLVGNAALYPRVPSLTILVKPGVVYNGKVGAAPKKRAEHGGYTVDDTHTALVIGSSKFPQNLRDRFISEPVENKQIAVTVLKALGLNPYALQGARAEQTQVLPGLRF